jgi:hypothetical protein
MGITPDLFRNETDGQSFSAGEAIFSKADSGDAMYVVLEGEVELRTYGLVIETIGPGSNSSGMFRSGRHGLVSAGKRAAYRFARRCRNPAIHHHRGYTVRSAVGLIAHAHYVCDRVTEKNGS